MSRTHSPLALGQSGLSTAAWRLSLFPCPVGAPVPPPHWVLAPGPAVKRVAPTPPRVEAGGGTPTPITLLRMLLSAALSACPASDRTTKAAAATETTARSRRRDETLRSWSSRPAGSAAKPFQHTHARFWKTSRLLFLISIILESNLNHLMSTLV